MQTESSSEFELASHGQTEGSVVRELFLFLRHNRKWWLLPIFFVLGLFGLLILLSGSGAAPFIYTLF
jgi:hypothetical protein